MARVQTYWVARRGYAPPRLPVRFESGRRGASFADLLRQLGGIARAPAGDGEWGGFGDLIRAAAARHGVDPTLVAAVAQTESGFDPGAVSRAGAKGLMQLMDTTARALGVSNPFDPVQSVEGGARYLAEMMHRFGRTDLALAAYNAGPGAVWRYDGIPPYPETQRYVRRVLELQRQLRGT